MTTLVWISGASAGLGAALAATVPYADAHVVDISRSGGTDGTEHLPADLADPASWGAVGAHFAAQLGGFDGDHVAFLHNAGVIEPIGFAGEVDTAAYRTNVLLNAGAPQVLGHAFLRAVREAGFQGRADLVMISSGAASKPYPGWSAYSAGKAAVEAWVRAVGAEQEQRRRAEWPVVRVLAIAPGVVATHMQEAIREVDEGAFPAVERFRRLHAEGRLTPPEEAARKVWSLVDGDAPGGSILDVRDAST